MGADFPECEEMGGIDIKDESNVEECQHGYIMKHRVASSCCYQKSLRMIPL